MTHSIDAMKAHITGRHLFPANDIGGVGTTDSRQTLRMMDDYSRRCTAAELDAQLQELADLRTRAACQEIKRLAPTMDELEAVNIIAALQSAFTVSMTLRGMERAKAADEALTDAVFHLERQEEA